MRISPALNVIRQAIKDTIQNGFTMARLDQWRRLLGMAILDDYDPLKVRQAMAAKYKQSITEQKKQNPSVSKFRLAQIEPFFRPELEKRIRASADLIVLNRKAMIDKTIRRFSGWMTSVPDNSRAIDKAETASEIIKPLRDLPFEERRVMIDQGHKLISNVSAIVREHTGAIAVIWRSHWRQAGYDYRSEHKERDGKIYAIRGNWAIERGLMKVGDMGYLDEITQPGEEVYCRCFCVSLTALSELPADMLTAKGKEVLNAINK